MVEKQPSTSIVQGAIYWVDAEPHAGHERGGHDQKSGNVRRPVMVVSNNRYNQGGMALVFPITSKQRESRYLMPIQLKKPSQIICTQILGYDMFARRAVYAGYDVTADQLAFLRQVVSHAL